eukprot:7384143-Prymnesium_polylepis.1
MLGAHDEGAVLRSRIASQGERSRSRPPGAPLGRCRALSRWGWWGWEVVDGAGVNGGRDVRSEHALIAARHRIVAQFALRVFAPTDSLGCIGPDLGGVRRGDCYLNEAHHAGNGQLAFRALLAPQQRLQDSEAVLDGAAALVHVLQCCRVMARGAQVDIVVSLLCEALLNALIRVVLVPLIDEAALSSERRVRVIAGAFVPRELGGLIHPTVGGRGGQHLFRFAVLGPRCVRTPGPCHDDHHWIGVVAFQLVQGARAPVQGVASGFGNRRPDGLVVVRIWTGWTDLVTRPRGAEPRARRCCADVLHVDKGRDPTRPLVRPH